MVALNVFNLCQSLKLWQSFLILQQYNLQKLFLQQLFNRCAFIGLQMQHIGTAC